MIIAAPRPHPSRPAYLPQLDGLRGFGMLLVIFAHLPRPSDAPLISAIWRAEHAVKLADIALDAFFVMSGFLITRLLLAERRRNGSISLRAFYLRRVLRIFPIYYLTVLAVTLIWPTDPARVASLALYGYNIYLPFHPSPYPLEQSWSLAVEEQFYLLWPLLLILLPPRWLERATFVLLPAAAILSAVLFAATASPSVAGELIYMGLPTRMLPLALGCGLAVLEQRGRAIDLRTALAAAALGSVLLVAAVMGRSAGAVAAGGWYWTLILPGVTLVSTGAVITLISPVAPRPLTALFSSRIARYLGRISYAAYLFHIPILFAFGINAAALDGGPAPWRASALVVILSLGLATLSWHLIERPLSRLKSRVVRQTLPA